MSTGKADLILHPIRLKIVTELANRQMTTTEIAALLPQVARATLYRHIKLLAEGGVLEVVGEISVNGAIERTYQVIQGAGRLSSEDVAGTSAKEHLQYFTTFVATLIDTFADYVDTAPLEALFDDGLSYNRTVVHLSDEERTQFQAELQALAIRMLMLPPTPNRRKYTLAQAVIPAPKKDEDTS
jgi:DNA-binding transcriptional ArsR family regulator